MTNNEHLKQEFEAHPERWVVEFLTFDYRRNRKWVSISAPTWRFDTKYRLRPVVPEGMDIPEEAYAYGPDRPGAVFVQGPVEKGKCTHFKGWIAGFGGVWVSDSSWVGDISVMYLIDLSDPNAEAILALERAGEVRTEALTSRNA